MKNTSEATKLVRDLRALGLSQSEIGRRINKTQAYVSHIERGDRGNQAPPDLLSELRRVHRSAKRRKNNTH